MSAHLMFDARKVIEMWEINQLLSTKILLALPGELPSSSLSGAICFLEIGGMSESIQR
jgi:hypothetical protein